MNTAHWADVLALRPEVTGSDGSVGELQMSLHKAVFQTVDVPYRKVEYFADITQPTPNLIGFLARLARRLGTSAPGTALFHLDQGMGGGKSHALVGAYHLAADPRRFLDTPLGATVRAEAEASGVRVDLTGTRVISLCADHFSPGKPTDNYGPATTLFERFLWALVVGDRARYDRYLAMGANKTTIQTALTDAGRPVLILLDELMDYIQLITDKASIDTLPGEQGFLNALMDACDDVPRVALVVVMIRSELDQRGYHWKAEEFREYIAARLIRNGTRVAVSEATDFPAIIRRRLFETVPRQPIPASALASGYEAAATGRWPEAVFDRLGPGRGLVGLGDRIAATYPFHPDMMRLVREEWSQVQGFQRVRSTIAIFAKTALYWVRRHRAGQWAPALVGIGDIPLTEALEQVLSSGLLLGSDRAIQGFRAVATTDISSADGSHGRGVTIDHRLHEAGVDLVQPAPAVRMATALFCYSLVARAQGRRGATKAELLAALLEPAPPLPLPDAEEVFNQLTGDNGLGALEITRPPNAPALYRLSITQTLRMYHTAAMQQVHPDERDDLVWKTAQSEASKGSFDKIVAVDRKPDHAPLDDVFRSVDSDETRLVLLDPGRWTLLNGRDSDTKADLEALFGLGPDALRVDNAASCVVVCVNTQRREHARRRAVLVLAWQRVLHELNPDDEDELRAAHTALAEETSRLKATIRAAYQHYAYLTRAGNTLVVDYPRFDDDRRSTLRGEDVWAALCERGRACQPGGLSETYLITLLGRFDRQLTLREVRQAFYKSPEFPLVCGLDEIRNAVFRMLGCGWEIVDAEGHALGITTAGQVGINSLNQTLAPARPLPDGPEPDPVRPPSRPGATSTVGPAPTIPKPRVDYKRYAVAIDSVSLTDPDNRDRVWRLLNELRKLLDPAFQRDFDHQLLQLHVTLTTAEGQTGDLQRLAEGAGWRFDVGDEDL